MIHETHQHYVALEEQCGGCSAGTKVGVKMGWAWNLDSNSMVDLSMCSMNMMLTHSSCTLHHKRLIIELNHNKSVATSDPRKMCDAFPSCAYISN